MPPLRGLSTILRHGYIIMSALRAFFPISSEVIIMSALRAFFPIPCEGYIIMSALRAFLKRMQVHLCNLDIT